LTRSPLLEAQWISHRTRGHQAIDAVARAVELGSSKQRFAVTNEPTLRSVVRMNLPTKAES
jgi:hypothetical protein